MADNKQVKREIIARSNSIKLFVSQIGRLIENRARGIIRKSFSAESQVESLNLLTELTELVKGKEYLGQLGNLNDIYVDEISVIRDSFPKGAIAGVSRETVEALIDADFAVVDSVFSRYLGDLRRSVVTAIFTGVKPDFDALSEEFGGRLASNLETELETAIASFNRTVTLDTAEKAGLELFLYAGPDDEVIRPFCEERVNQVFSIDEINSWDNGQGLPANTFLGGYNCRHRLVPVDLETAQSLGYRGN